MGENKEESETENKAESESEATTENKEEANTENKEESSTENKEENSTENKAESESESEAKTESKEESETEAKTAAMAKSQAKVEAKAKSKAAAKAKSEAKAAAKATAKAAAKAKAQKAAMKAAAKATVRLEYKMKSQDVQYQQEIEDLKSQMSHLVKLNQKLGENLIKDQKNNKNNANKEMISFIQNYDHKVNSLRKTFKSSKDNVETNFMQNNEFVKKAITSSQQKYSEITSEISELDQKVRDLNQKQEAQRNLISKGLEVDDLKINQNLKVDGVLYSKKIVTKAINLENIQLTSQALKVNGEAKIQLGNKVISFENIMNKMAYVDNLQNTCGKNFEKCRTVSDAELKKETNRQNLILKNLKQLRIESTELMRKRRR